MEIYRDIQGYEDYQISNLGRVKNIISGRVLKGWYNNNGYLNVSLYKDGVKKTFLVHRLVATAFIPNPDNLPTINHKDENPSNNTVENLEWCTQAYNNIYGTRTQRQSKTLKNGGKLSKLVLCVELDKVFQSTREVSRWLNKPNSKISDCCLGKRNTAYGYHWKYV